MKPITLKTKRLFLSPMTDDELRLLVEKEEEPHLKAAYGEMLAGAIDHSEDRLFYTAWTMARKEAPDEPIGNFSFKGTPVRGCVEIGYGTDEPYRGNGYMTEAVKKAVEWAFEQPGVYSVSAECEEDNVACRRVLE
ncbi:MAG: GNAT family N-acetyltransferase [Ruminococcus sp.]|nr:GNAT family N-acetyltransferase [Candidatus Apopatosoma intestinale]